MMDGKRVILAAHRGDRARYPENTMAAFRASLAAGVDMVENDIHMTSDGHLVIMHDRSALRTAGVDRNLDEMTLAEVRELDAGKLFSEEFRGERVPTVEEFLEWVSGTDLLVNWEFKDYPTLVGDEHAFASADKLVDLIFAYGMEKRSMLDSFSDRVLEHVAEKYGRVMPLHGQGIYHCHHAKDTAKMPKEELYDWCCLYGNEKGQNPVNYKENFDYCNEHGIIPCVCIEDNIDTYRRAVEYGCKMFTSNDILAADRILRELGVRG